MTKKQKNNAILQAGKYFTEFYENRIFSSPEKIEVMFITIIFFEDIKRLRN